MSVPHREEPSPRLHWQPSWRERWRGWRDTLLTSPAFRHRAAAFVLTRPVARRRAGQLFDLVAGFVYSQVLLACVRLRLFEVLAEGPQTPARLAERLSLPPDAAQRLLAAATALRLVERRGQDRYGLGALGAPMVGNPGVAAMVEHHAALYADLADPVGLLRAAGDVSRPGALARYWPYAEGAAGDAGDRVDRYCALMAASQPLVANDILDAYPLRTHRCLLDVGGGDGSFLVAAARRAPALSLMLFDLPAVAARAQRRFEEEGMSARARVVRGNFLGDRLPSGADIASLVRVIHDHDDFAAMTILRAVRMALPPNGTLLLAEPMSETPGAEAMGDAYFGFYLLAMGRGRPRTAQALTQLMEAAGFVGVRLLPTHMPLQTRLLLARVPV
jgi:demethylspheroidene O-methyltransferase